MYTNYIGNLPFYLLFKILTQVRANIDLKIFSFKLAAIGLKAEGKKEKGSMRRQTKFLLLKYKSQIKHFFILISPKDQDIFSLCINRAIIRPKERKKLVRLTFNFFIFEINLFALFCCEKTKNISLPF